jgi:long-chain acyl-CoA synthetase
MSANILQLIKSRAELAPESPFMIHLASGQTISYGELWTTTQCSIRCLGELGIKPRDRIVFAVRNHWLIFPLLAACNVHRAVLCPVDPELHRDELAHILGDAAPALTVAMEQSSLTKVPNQKQVLSLPQFLAAIASADPLATAVPESAANSSETVLMIYTSGTTGGSKWVMLSSANLLANAESIGRRYRISSADRFFCMLPTHHMNAIMITGLVPLTAGASIVLSDIFGVKNAKSYWQSLTEYGVTVASLVPSIMALLLKIFPGGVREATPQLRFAFCGAAPLSAKLWETFEKVFALPIHQGYGLTETTCWATSSRIDGPRRYDSVGVPLDCEIRIQATDDEDAMQIAGSAPGVAGEVWIRGAIVGKGYYKNKKLTSETLTADGFFRTGDLGYFDADQQLHITGRIKEIIIKNGTNVYSKDIDHVLAQHPAIKESKTIGIPDELVGERIYCACVLNEGIKLSALEIKAWLQERISQAMWPDAIILMGYLPAGAAGKITTNMLRKIITGQLSDEIVQSLNSWRYKRAQPSAIDQVKAVVQRSLLHGDPIHFLAYWGCGTRDHVIDKDLQTLARLREYLDGARRQPQLTQRLTLIFTDTHAQNNRIPEERMMAYWRGVRAAADTLGIHAVMMSDLWQQAQLDLQQIRDEALTAEFQSRWNAEALRPRLIEQAGKHAEQGFDPATAAALYYAICLKEAVALAKIFPHALFTTFNHPDFDCISPNLPKLYLYSHKEGSSVKPWFMDA